MQISLAASYCKVSVISDYFDVRLEDVEFAASELLCLLDILLSLHLNHTEFFFRSENVPGTDYILLCTTYEKWCLYTSLILLTCSETAWNTSSINVSNFSYNHGYWWRWSLYIWTTHIEVVNVIGHIWSSCLLLQIIDNALSFWKRQNINFKVNSNKF